MRNGEITATLGVQFVSCCAAFVSPYEWGDMRGQRRGVSVQSYLFRTTIANPNCPKPLPHGNRTYRLTDGRRNAGMIILACTHGAYKVPSTFHCISQFPGIYLFAFQF